MSFGARLLRDPRPIWRVDGGTGCWVWLRSKSGQGYGLVRANGSTARAHRLMYETVVGPIPKGMVVRHACDNRACVNPDHLSIGTPSDNSRDMVLRERQARGERQGSAKLTERDVIAIRVLADKPITIRDIGRLFGVGESQIKAIIDRRKWRHVK